VIPLVALIRRRQKSARDLLCRRDTYNKRAFKAQGTDNIAMASKHHFVIKTNEMNIKNIKDWIFVAVTCGYDTTHSSQGL
jgi:hypothetical protein